MEQPAPAPSGGATASRSTGADGEQDPAFAAIVANIERLDELDLATVEPASAFHWD
jgi:hypothetical protein